MRTLIALLFCAIAAAQPIPPPGNRGATGSTGPAGVTGPTGPQAPTLTAPVSASWTAFNTASMALAPTFASARFMMASSSQVGDKVQGVAIALPTAPYTRIFRIWAFPGLTAFSQAGIGWADGTVGSPGKFVLCGLQMGGLANTFGPVSLNCTNYTNSTTFSSSITQALPFNAMQVSPSGVPLWCKLVDDSTNWIFSVSWDGTNYVTVMTETRNTFLTATQLHVFVSGANSTTASIVFDSYN